MFPLGIPKGRTEQVCLLVHFYDKRGNGKLEMELRDS